MHDVQSSGGDAGRAGAARAGVAGRRAQGGRHRHATATIQMCREACGGAGYLAENRLPALKADTDVFTTFEGDNTVLLQLVAKGLLTGYRDAFGDARRVGHGRASSPSRSRGRSSSAPPPAASSQRLVDGRARPRREDADARPRLAAARCSRSARSTWSSALALRLRRAAEPDADAFAVFNDAQDHVIAAARAHVDRVVLEAFVAGVGRLHGRRRREALLDRLCDLYALSTIEADQGWFLEHGRLTPARSKAVTATVNEPVRASCARTPRSSWTPSASRPTGWAPSW